jgi:hypothetical protein
MSDLNTELTATLLKNESLDEFSADCRAKRTSVPYSADSLRHN